MTHYPRSYLNKIFSTGKHTPRSELLVIKRYVDKVLYFIEHADFSDNYQLLYCLAVAPPILKKPHGAATSYWLDALKLQSQAGSDRAWIHNARRWNFDGVEAEWILFSSSCQLSPSMIAEYEDGSSNDEIVYACYLRERQRLLKGYSVIVQALKVQKEGESKREEESKPKTTINMSALANSIVINGGAKPLLHDALGRRVFFQRPASSTARIKPLVPDSRPFVTAKRATAKSQRAVDPMPRNTQQDTVELTRPSRFGYQLFRGFNLIEGYSWLKDYDTWQDLGMSVERFPIERFQRTQASEIRIRPGGMKGCVCGIRGCTCGRFKVQCGECSRKTVLVDNVCGSCFSAGGMKTKEYLELIASAKTPTGRAI